jgi:hypothetical protein
LFEQMQIWTKNAFTWKARGVTETKEFC